MQSPRVRRPARLPPLLVTLAFLGAAAPGRAEVVLQYFETEWDEIYLRLPEIAECGYEAIWHPPPCKSPAGGGRFAGGGNVGYSLYDRFDLGDIPQRGALRTTYGTRGSLRNLADSAHQCDVRIIPDLVVNHNGNGPDFRAYPGLAPNDFHGWWNGAQPGGYQRPDDMSRYNTYGDVANGQGATFQHELVDLIDLQTERDDRFYNGHGPNYATPANFVRHPGQYDKYPFHHAPEALPSETAVQMLVRWINWLGYAEDFDGARIDAPKHVVADFFGTAGDGGGFNHNLQWSFDQRRGFADPDEIDQMYLNYLRRNDALIFGEMFIYNQSEVDYWRNFGVKMRYLDFPRKSQLLFPAFQNGDLAALSSFAGFSDQEGVMFAHSHDESPPAKLEMAYAYILTHVGLPVVYFTGNNLSGSDVNVRTWVKLGHGGALGDYNTVLPNLVYIHNQFARGREQNLCENDGDYFAFERWEDGGTAGRQFGSGEALMVTALNDSGSYQSRWLHTAFQNGTWLHDYSGHNATDLQVGLDGWVEVGVPAGGGQGWVCYAPRNAAANGEPIRFTQAGAAAPAMDWIVPGGLLAPAKPRTVPRLTDDTVDLDVYYLDPPGGYVDSVIVKWGNGDKDLNTNAADYAGNDIVSGGYEQAAYRGAAGGHHWGLTADLTAIPEGLHAVKARAFTHRDAWLPAVFQTFAKVVYVDRRGPDLATPSLSDGGTALGGALLRIENADRTASDVSVSVDGGDFAPAWEAMKGLWRFALPDGLAAGAHTLTVRALERDWGAPRALINSNDLVRAFTVSTNGPALGINLTEGQTNAWPFFRTVVTAPAGAAVRLAWDEYELAGVTESQPGRFEHVFDGRYVSGGVTQRLYGCFVNGPHGFEASAVRDGATQRLARTVHFNLYGRQAMDSDGDGLPDDVEMPNFSAGTSPGPNVPWPGDGTYGQDGFKDMIPNYGETWTRLNPLNQDTTYDGLWDGDEDWDQDGYPNLCEVAMGYREHGDPLAYDIYNAASHPTGCAWGDGGSRLPSTVAWDPTAPTRCPGATLTVTYAPHEGPLSNAPAVYLHAGCNGFSNATDAAMNAIGGGAWQSVYGIPTAATNVNLSFHDNGGTWDDRGGTHWNVPVAVCVTGAPAFDIDGQFDAAGYCVYSNDMRLYAAVRGQNLYVATWSANGNAAGSDHFLFVTDTPGAPRAAPWGKSGTVAVDTTAKPYLAAESAASGGGAALNHGGVYGRVAMGPPGAALEAEVNLAEVFGDVPEVVYLAAAAYEDADGGALGRQGPSALWSAGEGAPNGSLESYELLAVPVASIRDENEDGTFDVGAPQLWTTVDGHTRDANYDLRRCFIDERAHEAREITVNLRPNVAPGDLVTDVELFSNLNRREFAVLEEDPATVTPLSQTTYYRAYPMQDQGDGAYRRTLHVERCGVYRIDARYRVNGGPYVYYADHGLRRACAVVVSPPKALDLAVYELNPLMAEATGTNREDRSTFADLVTVNPGHDVYHPGYFTNLGVNLLWLQPIHPIGGEGRETDPRTGQPYEPGSPYAVRNYWEVNALLGRTGTTAQAREEFTNFVAQMDAGGVGVMLDATFNHSAWDCEIGAAGVAMGLATNPAALLRDVRPQWYSKAGDYGAHASYYRSAQDTDIAVAPDRNDFGKWGDVADFCFGRYDALVQGQDESWSGRHLFEQDRFAGHDAYTRELWRYFAYYPEYWLTLTGHPPGTPPEQAARGIDGLRCDFAQGLPAEFWEYCINRTRRVKWDFVFMAESLDGFRVGRDGNRHGVSYRSARQFDIMNEDLVFYWRDRFFNYPTRANPQPYTAPAREAFDARRCAFDAGPILNNLTCHDEIYPSHDPWRVLYAYAAQAAMDGAPMLFYGQEAGAQNDYATYANGGEIPNADHNFDFHELNFGKSIPLFKRFNSLRRVWEHRDGALQDAYGRINRARAASPALRRQGVYFLSRTDTGAYDPNLFAVARYEAAGASAGTQQVVFAVVNNNYWTGTNRAASFALTVTNPATGGNLFGLEAGRSYQVVDLLATNPAAPLWGAPKPATNLLAEGLYVGLDRDFRLGGQAQYLRLIEVGATYPDTDGDGTPDFTDWDDDNDGLPDAWEAANGLDPCDARGVNGAGGDRDDDGMSNADELQAGTAANDDADVLRIDGIAQTGLTVRVAWPSKADLTYGVQRAADLTASPVGWQDACRPATALSNRQTAVSAQPADLSNAFYRVIVVP